MCSERFSPPGAVSGKSVCWWVLRYFTLLSHETLLRWFLRDQDPSQVSSLPWRVDLRIDLPERVWHVIPTLRVLATWYPLLFSTSVLVVSMANWNT